MAAKFELTRTKNGQFHFNLKAGNGQIILSSEVYADKRAALRGVESVRKQALNDANFERRTASGGQPYFVLKATNGQVVGQSQMYATASSLEGGIEAVRRNAPDAVLDDQSVEA